MSNVPAFTRGGDAAEHQSKTASSYDRVPFLSMKDGESVIVRFLTDEKDWISVHQFGFLPTKPAPADWTGKWPSKMPAVSRQSRNDSGDLVFPWLAEDDFISQFMRDEKGQPYKASSRTWAFVCVREEVREGGRLLGYRDKMREHSYEKDGVTITEKVKDIQVANYGWKNFFSIFKGQSDYFGTVLDRDYRITRKGSGANDTSYLVIALDPVSLDDATCDRLGVPHGSHYDLQIPQIAALYKPTTELGDLIMERCSDEYYGRFFDTRVTAPARPNSASAQTAPAEQQARQETDVQQSTLDALTSRVLGYAAPAQGAAAPQDAPAVENVAPKAFID